MEVKDRILDFVSRSDYSPMRPAEVAEALAELGKESVQAAIAQLMGDGHLVQFKGDRVCLPRDADLIVGRMHFRQSGTALLFPDDNGEPLTISAEDTGVAFHGDTVVARLTPQGRAQRFKMGPGGRAVRDEKERTGRVIKILKRARSKMTGTLMKNKALWHVIPDDPRIVRNILVADPKASTLKPQPKADDKVVVELEEWKQRNLNPQGTIVEVLGRSHDPRTEHSAVFVQYGLQKEFPPAVEAEAKRVGVPVTEEQVVGRLDLRQHNVFTIDPDDAKDFDDALHIEHLAAGAIKVGIHIADVSAYVKPGSALDQEAQRRGNSTYLVGEVVPMLPHVLSSGVCSLKEAEDRLTKSVLVTFDTHGEIANVEYANTVIRSIKRLTYKQAKVFLDENDFEKIRQMPPPPAHQTGFSGEPLKALSNAKMRVLQTSIRQLWSIARRLRAKRMKAGSLDLDMPEAKIYIDERGYPERIEKVEHDESHQLIEEFMLLANQLVARAFNRQHMAAIHRVHDKPDANKLDELRETLLTMGIRVGDLTHPREIGKFLQMTKTDPKGVYYRGLFLRSLKQACYRAASDGHYGLAMLDYTHFTSPIRRYADFIVHRIFDAYLYRNALPTAPKTPPPVYNMGQLTAIAEHVSITEQNSTEAERQSVKNRLLEFFEIESNREPRKPFEAVITDVKNHGFFIELTQSMAFGFVHVSSLQSDFYVLSGDGQSMVGRRTQQKFSIGDKVFVVVDKVDRFKRQMDFLLARKDGVTMPPIPPGERRGQRPSQGKPRHDARQGSQGEGRPQNNRGGRQKSHHKPHASPYRSGSKRRR